MALVAEAGVTTEALGHLAERVLFKETLVVRLVPMERHMAVVEAVVQEPLVSLELVQVEEMAETEPQTPTPDHLLLMAVVEAVVLMAALPVRAGLVVAAMEPQQRLPVPLARLILAAAGAVTVVHRLLVGVAQVAPALSLFVLHAP